MATITFPLSPNINDTFTSAGRSWRWTGTRWAVVAQPISPSRLSGEGAEMGDTLVFDGEAWAPVPISGETAFSGYPLYSLLDTDTDVIGGQKKPVPSSDFRPGWYFINSAANQKYNYYFYNKNRRNFNLTLGNSGLYCIATVDQLQNQHPGTSLEVAESVLLQVYTTPQGAGDAAAWYRSRVTYGFREDSGVQAGVKYLFYFGSDPQIFNDLPRIQLVKSTASSQGPQASNEEILFYVCASNSNAPVNTVKHLVEKVGFVAEQRGHIDLEFEYALSTHSHSLSQLTQSAATSGQVPVWNGTAWVPQDQSGGGGVPTAQIDTFLTPGNWTKPTGAKSVHVVCIGGGGGGGGGARSATGTICSGGAGGGGGNYSEATLPASLLPSSPITILVGTGGDGRDGATTNSSNGGNGISGGNSAFGTFVIARGGSGGVQGRTGLSGGNGGTGNSRGMFIGGTGGNGSIGVGTIPVPATAGGGGGAGGAGFPATPANAAGNIGGDTNLVSGGTAGANTGGSGGNGNSMGAGFPFSGAGGGSGGFSTTVGGGNGGNGGLYGGGGGGGGGALNNFPAGRGGNGANGIVIVTTYF